MLYEVITIWGGIYREIHVNLAMDRLMATGLSSSQVENAIAAENINAPAGNVQSGLQRLYVRSLGEYKSLDQISETVLTVANGKPVRVKDVAEVTWGNQDSYNFV